MPRALPVGLTIGGLLVVLLVAAVPLGSAPAVAPKAGTADQATVGRDFASEGAGAELPLVPAGGATVNWENITPSGSSPPPREAGAMVWDSTDGYLLLFGGEHFNGLTENYLNDTWSFAGGVWTNRTTTPAPSPRQGMMMADDPSDGGVVLFGGTSGPDSFLNDTWFYAHGVWRNVTRPDGPPGRFWGSMSFDNATDSVVMYGGTETDGGPGHYADDMWSYHAGNWTELFPAASPGDMDDQSQVDDFGAHDLFLFGGENDTVYGLNTSWTYANGTWSPVVTPTVPGGRGGAGLAYDAAANAVVLYGGVPASFDYYATWIYAGGDWTEYNTTFTPPAGTIWGQIAYDAALDQVVMFEGDGHFNATYALGIAGSSSPSPLAVRASALPSSGTVPLTVQFNASAAGGVPPYVYRWTFGDAGASSALGNASYTYESVGTFTANLSVTDSAAHGLERNWTITVSPGPLTASISANPSSPTTNESVAFSSNVAGGDPPYTYAWSFGDGGTSTAADPTHSYGAAGSYPVSLVVTDSARNSTTRDLTVVVSSAPVDYGPPKKNSTGSSGGSLDVLPGVSWLAAVSLAVLVLLVLAALLLLRRRRRDRNGPTASPPPSLPGAPPPPAAPPPPPGAT